MKEKKAVTTVLKTFIGIVLLAISFFVVLSVVGETGTGIISEADELKCRTYVNVKDNLGIVDFFYSLNVNCKKDNFEIDRRETKGDVYETISQRALSCFTRYGSGESDFLSNLGTEGQFCFVCSKLTFEEDFDEEVSHRELIDYMDKTLVSGDPEGFTYSEKVSVVYLDADEEELEVLREGIAQSTEQLLEIHQEIGGIDDSIPNLILEIGSLEQDILDMRDRKFSGGDEMFIVYKLDRLDSSLDEALVSMGTGAVVGAIPGAVVGTLLTGPVGLGASVVKAVKLANTANKAEKTVGVLRNIFQLYGNYKKYKGRAKLLGALTVGVSGSGASAVVTSDVDYKSLQYVDVMTKHEYYRKCGTEGVFQE